MNLKAAEREISNETAVISKGRNYWLDNTKFLLILLVVLGHFISMYRKYEYINCLYYYIFLFHMPLFVFITGFFSKNVITKNKNKVLNYIVLYLIMQIIEIIITRKEITIVKPAYALWYLQAIIAYNLLLPTIHKMKPIVLCMITVFIGIMIGFDKNANTIASLSRIFVMLPFFIMGYFTSEDMLNKLKSKRNIIFAVIFLILVVMIIPSLISEPIKLPKELLWGSASYKSMGIGRLGAIYRLIWYILATLTSISVLTLVPRRKIKVVSRFGTRTLQVYCLHIIVILIFKQTGLYKMINTELELMCLIIGSVILTFLLSLKIFSYPFDFIMKSKLKWIYNEKI